MSKERWNNCINKGVDQMIKSAEGSTGLLHQVTKPTTWRGGTQILKKEEEYARVQNVKDQPWKNENLKKLEEALPKARRRDLKKGFKIVHKVQTGVGCDGFHPTAPLELAKETREELVGFLEKGGAEWKMVATSLHDDVLLDS